eukprot:TRINITY_DN3715_c0_g1_i2.p1 TRINITY_DN3715_c0_g1~~TRINITY_DN3715_c0_g1_i2.p1  ORF type:complete len:163 (+),score=25.13 TRINITY_DN3715_c0_g1_i2:66-491(+)
MSLRRPTDQQIRQYLLERQDAPFSYDITNGTMQHKHRADFLEDPLFAGYDIDTYRIKLGSGEDCFRKAVEAMKGWTTFDVGSWVTLCFKDQTLQVGTTVGILSWQVGFWVLSICRILNIIEEYDEDGSVTRLSGSALFMEH